MNRAPSRYLMLAAAAALFGRSAMNAQALSIIGGNQTMTVTTATVGSQPTAVNNTNVRLRVREQAAISKVTAQTSCPGQSFNLRVVVTSSPVGTIAPAVNLVNGMPATDILTSIPVGTRLRTVRIQYTASATFDQGTTADMGADVHTITYTLVAQ
jgi:hypothetical protein